MNNNKILTIAFSALCATSVSAQTALDGDWQLQQAGNTQATLEAAVDSVVKEMNFFIRGLARGALEKETVVCQQWQLQSDAQQFTWQCDDQDPVTLNLSGETLLKGDDDREIRGTFQYADGRIETTLASERGVRTNVWQLTENGEVSYTATLVSEKLPKPLTWTLTYAR
ncbi:hypothetical protein ACFQ45_05695 [Rhodanobacter aciditrophus]|uniref:Lipocalin-like domain-containing protein n=1 Tax=Rhodanobacter aciditrophus TaxID=1623218 RepID=A0ABW4B023_9GAMM